MLSPDALARQLDGLMHLDTQRAPDGIDLTVDAISRTTGPGQLDFGGGEFERAPHDPLTPVFDAPDDEYAWWSLDPGAYVVRYNESLTLTENQRAEIAPLERTLLAGAVHGSFVLTRDRDPLETLMVVSRKGCRLKENARLSRLTVQEFGA